MPLALTARVTLWPTVALPVEAWAEPGRNGEVQLTDALQAMLPFKKVYACEFKGTRYDIGDRMGLLKANVALALKRPDMAEDLRQFLSETLETIFD